MDICLGMTLSKASNNLVGGLKRVREWRSVLELPTRHTPRKSIPTLFVSIMMEKLEGYLEMEVLNNYLIQHPAKGDSRQETLC